MQTTKQYIIDSLQYKNCTYNFTLAAIHVFVSRNATMRFKNSNIPKTPKLYCITAHVRNLYTSQ